MIVISGTHNIPHYFVQPHTLTNFIYMNFPADSKKKFLGNDNAMAECWSGMPEDDPRITKLKIDHRNYKETCIPIVLHGDGVPCTNS